MHKGSELQDMKQKYKKQDDNYNGNEPHGYAKDCATPRNFFE